MTKPILSTPVMKLDVARRYLEAEGAGRLCAYGLMRLFGQPTQQTPRAIRLHAFCRSAKSRKRIRLRQGEMEMHWGHETTRVRGEFCPSFDRWLRRAPFADRLKKGETVTIYVSLEVVEGAAK